MYVRFVTPLIDADTRVETGIFHSRFELVKGQWPDWLEDAFQDEIDWFNEHLQLPSRLGIHFRRSPSIWGVCWFRSEAEEAIRRAQNYAGLLASAGVPVRRLGWRGPAQIIWSDEQQVVAAPTSAMPRAFH